MVSRLNKTVVVMAALAITVGTVNWLTSYHGPQLIGDPVRRIPSGERVVALTFDDGPQPPYTNAILEVLARRGVRATFFVVGQQVEEHPQLARDIVRRGHELGNHSWSHARLIFRSPAFVRSEIERTDRLLRRLGYNRPTAFRAPFGRKLITLPAVLDSMNKRHVLFDVVPGDWERPPVDVIVNRTLEDVRPGSIILLHDGGGDRAQTVQATDELIAALERIGYRFVTVSELLGDASPAVAQYAHGP